MPDTIVKTEPAKPVDLRNYRGFRSKAALWEGITTLLTNRNYMRDFMQQFGATKPYLFEDFDFQPQ